MRTIFLSLVVLLFAADSYSQLRINAGISYGTEVNNPGLGFGAEYFVNEQISVNPGVIIFFEDPGIFDDRDWWEINIDGHYYFAEESDFEFYGIAGLNIVTRAIELGEVRDADTEVGLNMGIGTNYQWKEHVLPYFAIKYIAGKADQAVFTFGCRFLIRP